MGNFVENLPPVLAEAIEANLLESLADLGRSPRVEFHQESDVVWFVTGMPYPSFNRILHARFESGDIDARIESALSPFKLQNLPMLWHTGPTTRPPELGEHLIAHGLRCASDEPGMAVDLQVLDDEGAVPPGLMIEPVRDLDGLRAWSEIFAAAFGRPEGTVKATFAVEADLGVGEHPWRRLYLGLLAGKPVATSRLFLGAGVAGIYGVGSMPQVRRRGIGQAMTVMPLLEARAMGYRLGVLHVSPMGVGVYRRLGFREYCRLCRYVWPG